MVRADEAACAGPACAFGADARATVAAYVQERPHLTIGAPDDEDRFPADLRGYEVTDCWHLAGVTCAVPVPLQQATLLTLEKLRVAVEFPRQCVPRPLRRNRARPVFVLRGIR